MEQQHLSRCIERTLHNYALNGEVLPVFESISRFSQLARKSQPLRSSSANPLKFSMKGENSFNSLLEACLENEGISADNAEQILDKALSLLTETNASSSTHSAKPKYVQNLSTVSEKGQRRVIIVGSLHGQLHDFNNILTTYGRPSAINQYIFNGNIVHGSKSVELLLLVLYLKCILPDHVFINRGPHEIIKFYYYYGFRDELISRHYNQSLCAKFDRVIESLSLMTIINNFALVMSGGPAPNLKRKDIEDLMVSVDNLPLDSPIHEMMWAEPKLTDGFERTSRIVGYKFGPKETDAFLSEFKVSKLIRSFGVIGEGFSVDHGERCISIFSAANYRNMETTKSATIVHHHENIIDVHINKIPNSSSGTDEVPRDWLAEYNVFMMNKIILMSNQSLQYEFHAKEEMEQMADRKLPSGFISYESWLSVMQRVIGKDYPWEKLKENLISKNHNGCYDWVSFLKIHCHSENQSVLQRLSDSVTQNILKDHKSPSELFESMDDDKDGAIPYKDFVEKIKSWTTDVSEVVVSYFLDIIDKNQDGVISKEEFLESFRVSFGTNDTGLTSLEIGKVKGFYNRIREDIQHSEKDMRRLFSRYTVNGTGLTSESLFALASHYNIILNSNQSAYLMSLVDINGDGKVDFNEFIESFGAIRLVDPEATSGWRKKLLHRAAGIFARKFGNLRRAFVELDKDGSGSISLDELSTRIPDLNRSGEIIPTEDIGLLMKIMDVNDRGSVTYSEFVKALSEFISYGVGES